MLNIFSLLSLLLGVACSKTSDSFIHEADGPFFVDTTVYNAIHSSKDKEKQILIIVPPTGGTNIIDKMYAKSLSSKGFKVVILNDFYLPKLEDYTPYKIHTIFYNSGLKAIKMIVDKYPEYEVNILGTSVGGLHTSVAVSQIDRIKKAFIIVAGAPIHQVIGRSSQKAMAELKEKRRAKNLFENNADYFQKVKNAMPYEPLSLELNKKAKLGMSISLRDRTVPTDLQLKLRDYWKPKKVIYLEHNHKRSVILTWLLKSKEVLNFFLEP